MIVFTADCHLSPTIWAGKPGLKFDSYFSFEQIVAYCVGHANEINCLILGGDIFDRPQPYSQSVVFFISMMNKLREHGIPVYAIQGQHDRSAPSWTDVHDHVVYVGDGREFNIDCDGQELSVTGLDCMPATALRDRLSLVTTELVLLHQMHRQAIDFEGAWDFDPAWLPENVRLVLMGDNHPGGDFDICHYSGSTHVRAINEPREKSFLTVKVVGDEFKIERQPLETRDILEFLIDSDESLQAALDELKQYKFSRQDPITQPVVAAHIAPTVEKARERFEAGLAELLGAVHFMPYVAAGPKEERATPSAAAGDVTLQACLSTLVKPEQDAELHSFVLSLLESNDPRATLAEHKKRLGMT